MATVYVNDKPVEIGEARLNAIEAAQRAGVFIPHYCWHPALTVVASCRMCLVEVGELKDDGTVQMQPKVVPGCQTPVKHNMVIVTGEYGQHQPNEPIPTPLNYPANYGTPGQRAKKAQADTLEGLLLNHPLDCPVCDKAGECKLQDFSYQYGRSTSRMIDEKNTPPNKPYISSKITLFTDRCIMCTRCVRFTREYSGQGELTVLQRGEHAEIDIFPGEPLENKLSLNVVDLCPVGALGSKDFLYKQRVWYLKSTDSVCPDCSTGCSIHLDTNKDIVYRLRPRENPRAQGWFMCDEGRLGYRYLNSKERLMRPLAGPRGQLGPKTWREIIPALRRDLADRAGRSPDQVVAILSPWLTCEEAFLLARYIKGLAPTATLALGPVPIRGEDDTYPKDRRGRPMQPVRFTIRAEKCPNRRGVEEVLRHFQGEVIPFDRVRDRFTAGQVNVAWVTIGASPDRTGWDEESARAVAQAGLLIVQDLFAGVLTQAAQYVLPSCGFSEKEGTFVNHAGLAQGIRRATNPPQEARAEGQVYLDLMGVTGLFQAASVRRELAATIPFFAPLAAGMDPLGIRLGQVPEPVA
ncbi:MAG: molybdopterin-dependent oxidoreductase [Gemmataceae bacterium]|nr:molybdopterin-dependent oxidoreductase [Gemmataceae bacterium]